MKNIAVIPARSGSKGLKDKNIKDLCGHPLLWYTVRAAVESGVFDEVMVSTDSERYASVARECGANVPFLRSEKTSTDTASSWDMIDEVLEGYQKNGRIFDNFCLLQPTSPLRDCEDIKNAYNIFTEKNAFAVISVCEAEHSPLWCGKLPESGEFTGFINPDSIANRQKNGKYYRLNGAIYFVNINRYRNEKFLYVPGSYAYIMENAKSVDIDNELDFKFAEFLANENNKGE